MFKCFVATREAKWLLSDQAAHYLDKVLRHRLLELQALDAELEGVPVGPDRSANVKKQTEIKNWLGLQFDALDENFAPYLRLTH